jgi:hypothetical protein
MTEQDKWQILMHSCRRACKLLNIDFKEPMYLDWTAGRNYYSTLWGQVRLKKFTNVK